MPRPAANHRLTGEVHHLKALGSRVTRVESRRWGISGGFIRKGGPNRQAFTNASLTMMYEGMRGVAWRPMTLDRTARRRASPNDG